jgi:quercetin dioxygenase-like cupin family protein
MQLVYYSSLKMPTAKVVKVSDVKAILPPKHSEGVRSFPLVKTPNLEVFVTEFPPGAKAEIDVHPDSEHAFFVLSGKGKWVVENEEYELEPNMFLWMPKGAKHANWTVGDETLRVLVLFAPGRK